MVSKFIEQKFKTLQLMLALQRTRPDSRFAQWMVFWLRRQLHDGMSPYVYEPGISILVVVFGPDWISCYCCRAGCTWWTCWTSMGQRSLYSSWYLALTAFPATVSGRGVPGEPTERLWARNLYTLRGVRGGGRRVLVLRRGPLLSRHRENDRSQAGNLLAGLLELHQPSLPLGERQLQRQAHVNNV